ncbi:MAG: hypothetical protein KAT58_08385 [candidate division Zixibacteria bacterium]|nr:hypothetical protein [candidate division Zixibacteria bacterium]
MAKSTSFRLTGKLLRLVTNRLGSLTRILPLLALALLITCSAETDEKSQIDLSKLLPDKGELAGFAQADGAEIYDEATIWDYIGPNADTYLYNGFQRLHHTEYEREADGARLIIDIFEFSDPRQCFALYAHLRSSGYEFIDVETEGFVHNDTLTFKKSNYLVRLVADTDLARQDVLTVAQAISGKIEGNEPFPEELALFAGDNLIGHSEKLTLASFWGKVELSNIFCADYQIGADTVTLCFRLGADNQMTTVVSEYIGNEGTIKEILIDRGYQTFVGYHERHGNFYCTVCEGILCFLYGFDDKATAVELAESFFSKVRRK